jgi:gluconate 5-dehydrogenase
MAEYNYAGFSLVGKSALITGASRGLGLAMAKGLAQAGATVYINGRNKETLENAVAALLLKGITVKPLAFDVEDEIAADTALRQLENQQGGLDILINNVGIRDRRGMFDLDITAFNRLLNNHVSSTFSLVRRVAATMKNRGSGRIINLVSVAAFRAVPEDTAYITAKGAVAALTRAQAAELGQWGITVNAIAPGGFATETNKAIAESEQGKMMVANRSCLKRWGTTEEITGAAVFLSSPAASYITGHILVVDGGVLAQY